MMQGVHDALPSMRGQGSPTHPVRERLAISKADTKKQWRKGGKLKLGRNMQLLHTSCPVQPPIQWWGK